MFGVQEWQPDKETPVLLQSVAASDFSIALTREEILGG
jgi:hypothetical protein